MAVCPECGSTRTWRDGSSYTGNGPVQRFLCRVCGFRFSKLKPKLVFREDYDVIDAGRKMSQVPKRQFGGDISNPQPIAYSTDKIIEYGWWLKKNGKSDTTIEGRTKLLKILEKRGANFYDPETVKEVIAKQPWSNGRKNNAVDAYSSFLRMVGGNWEAPLYKTVRKLPFIPKETEIDQLISGCSRRMATFLQTLKETGARCGEIWSLKWLDIDFESKVVYITPEKDSNPRAVHLSNKLLEMLEKLPKTYGDRVFSFPSQPVDHHANTFCHQRKRISSKVQNPKLLKIHFHTLRYWKGTMLYHQTKDMYYVMQRLGHKNIKNTMLYIQLEEALFQGEQDFTSKVAKTEKEVCDLIEAGFEYVTDFEGAKIFKKRKL
jgi:integrase